MNLMKLEPSVIFFRPQKRIKVIMIMILKYLEPPIVGEQFQIVLNKLNGKIRIFQDPLNFFQFYLIYFYTHGISFSEMYARELIFEVSRYLILIVMWIQPISSFTELVN